MNVAIIPARGGSKRIPRKNIKLFHGQPIIAYSIMCALKSGCFDRVIVSTDDEEIAAIARQYGAETPFIRPAKLADDYASTVAVVKHAIESIEQAGTVIDYVCCIYATSPFINVEDLQQGLHLLQQQASVHYVFSAVEFEFPIQRAIKLNNNGEVSMFMPEYEQSRSQDLQRSLHDAGQFYWGKKEAFSHNEKIFSSHSRVIEIPAVRAIDIDTPQDWELAEALYQYNVRHNEDSI